MQLTAEGFVSAVAALIGRPLTSDEPFAVAVSGGPDSLALLRLAHGAFGDRVRAVTVDHAFRPESAAEAEGVAALCDRLGVHHAILVRTREVAGSLQAAAREARYALMTDWCEDQGVAWLATAHHADDQAETMLMRLARGAGLSGLSGIRPVRPLSDRVMLIRPLLAATKAELSALVADLDPIDDPSNRDPRHDRSQARALLAATPWFDPHRLAASAAHLAEAEAALEWATEAAWRSRVALGLPLAIDTAGLPRALAAVDPGGCFAGPEVDRMLVALDAGGAATLGAVKASGGALWTFAPAPPRRAG